VDFATASRRGEPFDALIAKKRYLPNPVARICTTNLKIRTLARFLISLGWEEDGWTNAVGLRADEPRRVSRMRGDRKAETVVCPLATAGVTREDVDAWWSEQPFRLDLPLGGNLAGNCVGCFLKGRGKLDRLMRAMPEEFEWWAAVEEGAVKTTAGTGARFRSDRPSYRAMLETARTQGLLFDEEGFVDDDTIPCFCTD